MKCRISFALVGAFIITSISNVHACDYTVNQPRERNSIIDYFLSEQHVDISTVEKIKMPALDITEDYAGTTSDCPVNLIFKSDIEISYFEPSTESDPQKDRPVAHCVLRGSVTKKRKRGIDLAPQYSVDKFELVYCR
jgi:hypothetical protein